MLLKLSYVTEYLTLLNKRGFSTKFSNFRLFLNLFIKLFTYYFLSLYTDLLCFNYCFFEITLMKFLLVS